MSAKQILHHLLSFEELQGKAASVPLPEQANDAEVEALHFWRLWCEVKNCSKLQVTELNGGARVTQGLQSHNRKLKQTPHYGSQH